VIVLKRYGFPPVQAIGKLPLLRMITLIKYDEPILSVCVAALCGIGLERIVTRAVSWRLQTAALLGTFSIVGFGALASRNVLLTAIASNRLSPAFPFIALALPVSLLFCLAICYVVYSQAGWGTSYETRRYLAIAIVLLVAIEMSLNFIPEVYYVYSRLPDVAENPYSGAPYIQWLKAHNSDRARVFGRGSTLYPDWASVFELSDIRDLDALYYWKYLPFIRNFMLPPGQLGTDDFRDRFTGGGHFEYRFTSPIERRLLELTSCKYLISTTAFTQPAFQLNYDREVKIYRYGNVLPRVTLYSRVKIARGDSQVLRTLADPEFNVFSTVVLNSVQLSTAEAAHVAAINNGQFRLAESGNITGYQPMDVEIESYAPESRIMVLNDAEYPGWEAIVDGKPGKILSANYLFRGLLLAPGRHRVSFVYRPRSFRYGAIISLSTAFGLLAFWFVSQRKSLRKHVTHLHRASA
jgi:hypothetical protein